MAMERIAVSYRLDARLVRRMRDYVDRHGGSCTALVERALARQMDEGDRNVVRQVVDDGVRVLGPGRLCEVIEDAIVSSSRSDGVA